MPQPYFITAQDVKDHTDVQQNVDAQQLEPRFARCQEKYIKPVLGEALYEELEAAHQAEQHPDTPVPMADNLDVLLEQIVPVLSQWVFFKSLPFMVVKATNKALTAATDSPCDAQYRAYAKEVKEEAEDRTEKLRQWLETNKGNYPNYMATMRAQRPIGGIVL